MLRLMKIEKKLELIRWNMRKKSKRANKKNKLRKLRMT